VHSTLNAAVTWLRDLVAGYPQCAFFYTLGNHDCFDPFVERLEHLATELPNLHWHPSHVRLGRALFLHGDLPLTGRTERAPHPILGPNGRSRRLLYDVFVAARGHRAVAAIHRPRPCAKRIARWIRSGPDDLGTGITDVYFGHTHRAFSDFEFDGLRFHNTGSSIRGLSSRMLKVPAAVGYACHE
jgi:UDP-2,3-diacylglucosamine hydrolase